MAEGQVLIMIDPLQWASMQAHMDSQATWFEFGSFGLGLVVFLLAVQTIAAWRR